MEFEGKFKFLKLEQMKRKNADELEEGERFFFIISLLDNYNNPCRFFIFNKDLINKIINSKFVGLQDVLCHIKVSFTNNNWQVNLVDINK